MGSAPASTRALKVVRVHMSDHIAWLAIIGELVDPVKSAAIERE